MAEGRGSASIFLILLFCMSVFHSKMVHSETYRVGGDILGWHFGVQEWPTGKTFKEGDQLAFNYIPATHNVLVVDENSYNNCPITTTPGNGSEVFTLSKGSNYFICGYPGHCNLGMRIAVNAS